MDNREMSEREKKLATQPIKPLLISFAVPAIIGMLVNALYNIVDRFFIGKIKDYGSYALTGIGITFPITTIILGFAMLIGLGAAANISIKLGERKKNEAEKILGNAVSLVGIIGISVTIIGMVFSDTILGLFGASDMTIGYAKEYINIILLGSVFNIFSFSINHSIRAAGNPKRAASTQLLGAGLNIILDPIFIFVFGWGVKGAAIATVISQIASSLWVLSYFVNKGGSVHIRLKNLKPDLKVILTIFAIGISPFSMQVAGSIVSIVANKTLFSYGGDMAIGAMTVINSVSMLFMMPVFGINQGAQPILGYNYGAKNYKRVRETLKYSVVGGVIIAVIGFAIIELFPEKIIMFFNKDEKLVEIGSQGLQIFLCMLPLVAPGALCANFFQSLGKAKTAMFLSLLRQVVLLIPLYIILPRFWGLKGVWMAAPIADFTSFVVIMIFTTRELSRLRHLESETI